jgi:hypothetical protein
MGKANWFSFGIFTKESPKQISRDSNIRPFLQFFPFLINGWIFAKLAFAIVSNTKTVSMLVDERVLETVGPATKSLVAGRPDFVAAEVADRVLRRVLAADGPVADRPVFVAAVVADGFLERFVAAGGPATVPDDVATMAKVAGRPDLVAAVVADRVTAGEVTEVVLAAALAEVAVDFAMPAL